MNLKNHSKGFVQTKSTLGTRGSKASPQRVANVPKNSPNAMPKNHSEAQRLQLMEDRGQR